MPFARVHHNRGEGHRHPTLAPFEGIHRTAAPNGVETSPTLVVIDIVNDLG